MPRLDRPAEPFWREYERILSEEADADVVDRQALGQLALAKARDRPRLDEAAKELERVLADYGDMLTPALMQLLAPDIVRIATRVAKAVIDGGETKAERRQRRA